MSPIYGERTLNNFDFVRLAAAAMVVASHSFDLLGHFDREPLRRLTNGHWSFGFLGVCIFFVMSGYLITQSLDRSKSYGTYFAKRGLRIFPALFADLLIAVFIFGPLLTSYSLGDYFNDPLIPKYLANASLYLNSYQLPGVFTDHPNTLVNGSLWTLCYEFTCYVAIVVMHRFGFFKRRGLFLLGFCATLAFWARYHVRLSTYTLPPTAIAFKDLFPLSLYFGAGALCYLYRDRLRYSGAVALCVLVALLITSPFDTGLLLSYIALPYVLFAFVFTPNKWLGRVGLWGDFSYGTYIYSFPIQQIIISALSVDIPVALMICLSFAFTIPFAAFSWFVIEKPALRLKERLFRPKPIRVVAAAEG